MARRLLLIVAITLGIAAGLLSVLRSPRFLQWIKQEVSHQAALQGLDLRIGSIEIRPFSLGLRVSDVVGTRLKDGTRMLSLHHGEISLQPWPSATGAITIERITLDGMKLDLELDTLGETDDNTPTSPQRIDIRYLDIVNSRLKLKYKHQSVQMDRIEISLAPTPTGRSFAAEVPVAYLDTGEQRYDFETVIRAVLVGSLDRPKRVELQHGQLFLKEFNLQAHGKLPLESDVKDEAVLTVETQLGLHQLNRFFPFLPALGGTGDTRITLRRGTDDILKTRAEVNIVQGKVEGRTIGDITLDAFYSENILNIESFALKSNAGGRITGSGQIVPDDNGGKIELTTRLHAVSLPAVLATAGLPGAWVRMSLDGDIKGHGRLQPFRLDLNADLKTDAFESLTGSYTDTQSEAMLSLGPSTIKGKVRIDPKGATLQHLDIVRGASEVALQGVLHADLLKGLEITAWSKDIGFDDIGAIADIEFMGRGAMEVNVSGPYEDIRINSNVFMEGFKIFDFPLGDADAAIEFHNGILSSPELEISAGTGTISGSGSINFDEFSCKANINILNVDAPNLLRMAGLEDNTNKLLVGKITGAIELRGPLLQPTGTVKLTSPNLALQSASFGKSTVEASFARGAVRILTSLDGKDHKGTAIAATTVIEPAYARRPDATNAATNAIVDAPPPGPTKTARTTIDVEARYLSLDSIQALMGNIPITGALSGKAHLVIDERGLNGNYQAEVNNSSAWDMGFERVTSAGEIKAGTMQLKGALLSGDCSLVGSLVLGEALPYVSTVTCKRFNVNRIVRLPNSAPALLKGTIFSQGKLTDAMSQIADANFEQFSVRLGGHTLSNTSPIRVQYESGKLRLLDLQLRDERVALSGKGDLGIGGPLDLQLALRGDAGILSAIPSIGHASGSFHSKLAVRGSWERPAVFGNMLLKGIEIVPAKGLKTAIENINVDLRFSGQSVTWHQGTARFGGGDLRFEGGYLLGSNAGPTNAASDQLDFIMGFKDVSLRPKRNLFARVSGNLVLSGPLQGLVLSGNVDVHEAEYRTSISIDPTQIFGKSVAPFQVPEVGGASSVALDVEVRARDSILLSGGAVEAEFKADVRLTGSIDRPGLLGNMTALWGTARYRELEFKIERGSVDFVDRFSIAAQFDVLAKAEGCGMQIQISLMGDSKGAFEAIPTGQAPGISIRQDEVLACLITGATPSGLQRSGNIRGPAVQDGLAQNFDVFCEVSGVCERLRQLAPGIDEQRITFGPSGRDRRVAPRFILGKRLGEHLVLRYESAPTESDHVMQVNYMLNDNLSFSAGWNSISRRQVSRGDWGLDLRLHLEHD